MAQPAGDVKSVTRPMPPQLLALTEGPSILLDKPILLLGRHQECDIQLVSRKVSRRHCCIAQVGDHLVVRDLGSTNGIRINGNRVLEGSLKPGDELTIGSYRYQVRWEAVEADPPPRPRRRTAVRQEPIHAAPSVVDDQILEECEEPLPLAEPGGKLPFKHRPEPRSPEPDSPSLAGEPEHATAPALEPQSSILPEVIELAPPSDLLPNGKKAPPPSK
jgi:pSer/pThr/pTyr-binding forkhead associated (FHA) protein